MQGNYTYCKKHGHDWKILNRWIKDGIEMKDKKCMRCEKHMISCAFYEYEADE